MGELLDSKDEKIKLAAAQFVITKVDGKPGSSRDVNVQGSVDHRHPEVSVVGVLRQVNERRRVMDQLRKDGYVIEKPDHLKTDAEKDQKVIDLKPEKVEDTLSERSFGLVFFEVSRFSIQRSPCFLMV